MSAIYGGVETGGTWCVCAAGTGPQSLLAREQFRTEGPAETLGRIIAFFGRHPVGALGVGSFGPLDLDPASPTWGHVTGTPKSDWRSTAVAPVLQEALGVPVAFDTDVAAAAVAERRWGAGQGAQSLCYLTVGTGIGGALLGGSRLWHGLIHPEMGHLRLPRVPGDEFGGSCPLHGDCWEGLASGRALAERFGVDPAELPDDHPAWELEAGYLAAGLYSIIAVACPHRLVIGGGVLERSGLLDRVRVRLAGLNSGYLELPALDGYLVAPGLGDDAGVLGAIALAESLVSIHNCAA